MPIYATNAHARHLARNAVIWDGIHQIVFRI
jgi:hypothetical protein